LKLEVEAGLRVRVRLRVGVRVRATLDGSSASTTARSVLSSPGWG